MMKMIAVANCNICRKPATIGAENEQLQTTFCGRCTVVKGYCNECEEWRMVSVIDSKYYEMRVRPIYWIDLDEVQV